MVLVTPLDLSLFHKNPRLFFLVINACSNLGLHTFSLNKYIETICKIVDILTISPAISELWLVYSDRRALSRDNHYIQMVLLVARSMTALHKMELSSVDTFSILGNVINITVGHVLGRRHVHITYLVVGLHMYLLFYTLDKLWISQQRTNQLLDLYDCAHASLLGTVICILVHDMAFHKDSASIPD